MASRSVDQPSMLMEVQSVDRKERAPRTVQQLDRLKQIQMKAAKAGMGACLRDAIGPRAHKEFGDESFVGKVCSGEKVPDYLAHIYHDKPTRRRFGLALLTSDDDATVHVSLPPLKKDAK